MDNDNTDQPQPGMARVHFRLARGPLSEAKQTQFVHDLAHLLGVQDDEIKIVKQTQVEPDAPFPPAP